MPEMSEINEVAIFVSVDDVTALHLAAGGVLSTVQSETFEVFLRGDAHIAVPDTELMALVPEQYLAVRLFRNGQLTSERVCGRVREVFHD